MYYFNDDKFIMEITRCVVGEQSEPTLWQFVRARKIRIPYNITVCTRRVGPLANTITVRRTRQTETLQYMLLILTHYT